MSDVVTILDNIVSHFELEEASGTRADSHGSNDLTDNNTVTQATGKQGNAADFEASNNEFLSITDAAQSGLDLSGAMSFSFWIKFETLPTSGNVIGIVTKDDLYVNTTGRSYAIDLYNNGGTQTLRFFISSVANPISTQYREYAWTHALSTGVWYHMVFTYDPSLSGATRGKLYINNSDKGAPTVSGTWTGTTTYNSTSKFVVGKYDVSAAWIQYLDGVVDELTVTSDVITSGEVSSLYNSGNGVPYDSGGGAPAQNSNFLMFM